MSEQTFDGTDRAGEIFFVSRLDREETLKKVKNKIAELCPYNYIDTSDSELRLEFKKRRLFFCEYNIHCDITFTENRYRLQLFYDMRNISWTYGAALILFFVFCSMGGMKWVFSFGETTGTIIGIVCMALVLRFAHVFAKSEPAGELQNLCNLIKKELEAFIKLEIEP